MSDLLHLNLIRVFNFYLAFVFLVGLYRRAEQYRTLTGLVWSGPGRWPRLLKLVSEHRTLLLTWATVRPAALALLLTVVQFVASRLVWPQATLSATDLWAEWWWLPVVAAVGAGMATVDALGILRVAPLDRAELEKYLDQAEFWLRGWKAPVVRALTFGRVNPRLMVDEEVRKALVAATELLNRSLWWVSMQLGLRIAFGLSLWLAWGWLR